MREFHTGGSKDKIAFTKVQAHMVFCKLGLAALSYEDMKQDSAEGTQISALSACLSCSMTSLWTQAMKAGGQLP